MARSMGAFLMGLMPASVTHPLGEEIRGDLMTLMRAQLTDVTPARYDRAYSGRRCAAIRRAGRAANSACQRRG